MKTTVEIKKMGINGEGIGYINRKVVFVKGALLGETVEVDAQQYKNKNYYFGDLIRVVQASPMRVKIHAVPIKNVWDVIYFTMLIQLN